MMKRFAWLTIIALTLLALLHAIENFRGARALEKAVAEVAADGETIDFDDLLLEPVADEENFGAIPLLKNIAVVTDGDTSKGPGGAARKRIKEIAERMKKGGEAPKLPKLPEKSGEKISLDEWATYFQKHTDLKVPKAEDIPPAEVVAAGLAEFDSLFAELESAIDRPHARFSPGMEQFRGTSNLYSITMPQLQTMLALSKLLTLRSHAMIETGETETATRTLRAQLRVAEMSAGDGMLIGTLVYLSELDTFQKPFWSALELRSLFGRRVNATSRFAGKARRDEKLPRGDAIGDGGNVRDCELHEEQR